jgi:hypothetical protein
MNREIERLAGTANFGHIEKFEDVVKYDPRLEAFAKLIIEKCAELCVKNEYFNEHSVASEYAMKAAEAFKSHFGMDN